MILTEVNDKQITLDDPQACRLVKTRAMAERRSARSALVMTVIEGLQAKYQPVKDSGSAGGGQVKKDKSLPGDG